MGDRWVGRWGATTSQLSVGRPAGPVIAAVSRAQQASGRGTTGQRSCTWWSGLAWTVREPCRSTGVASTAGRRVPGLPRMSVVPTLITLVERIWAQESARREVAHARQRCVLRLNLNRATTVAALERHLDQVYNFPRSPVIKDPDAAIPGRSRRSSSTGSRSGASC